MSSREWGRGLQQSTTKTKKEKFPSTKEKTINNITKREKNKGGNIAPNATSIPGGKKKWYHNTNKPMGEQ